MFSCSRLPSSMNWFTISSIVSLLLGQGNWNRSSNVPDMKDMIQSKVILKDYKFTETNRSAIDTPYVVKSDTPNREFIFYAYSCDELALIHRFLDSSYPPSCDSLGDLYPVTRPSTLPVAFLSTSSSTWHQRLGHPRDEVLRSLIKNGTWVLVPRPTDANLVLSRWSFKHKFHADGTLSRYKARLVANGSSQQLGVDFDETFSPIVKPATIRTVLSLVVSQKWPIHQLDVKNAFLNGDLFETVYMHQPPGYATRAGFSYSHCDSSLFIFTQGSHVAYLLIYVDDIILTASSTVLLQQLIDSLHKEFDMTNLGALNYFLGIFAVRHPTGLFLSQKKYARQFLECAHMVNCNLSRTPVDTDSKLGPDGVTVQDPTLYRSLAGGLQYLTFTRPDLSYAVQQICLYMHDPREPHFAALKRILRYVQGTLELGLHLYASATTSLVGYTDADWAGCPSTRRAEAEYQGVANVVAETAWIRNLLHKLHSPLLAATLVYCDNVSAVYMSANPVQHQRTKHIEIDTHFVRDMVKARHVWILHVSSRFQSILISLPKVFPRLYLKIFVPA
ncbi:ribonuclease H-like domain-containing protein [Tanacetum coccineum]|uniref:Ribonuclease H-like domain-containing protein n=1 Tax=Tanacetum coccineum TaxID=301880 RepID=A0ABQ5DWL7_9ASTR